MHMDLHNGIKKFCCDTCGKRFSKGFNLKVHLNSTRGCRVALKAIKRERDKINSKSKKKLRTVINPKLK